MANARSKPLTAIKVVSQTDDSWNVKFTLDVRDLLDTPSLVERLHEVKRVLSETRSVPVERLAFDEILEKVQYGNYVDVVVRMYERIPESGKPEILFKDEHGPDGDIYSRMQAFLRFFYFDESKTIITRERLIRGINEAGVKTELLDEPILSTELERVVRSRVPSDEILIARGRLPEHGSDAEVELFFQATLEESNIDLYRSTRQAKAGDILCRKTPFEPGRADGYNVLGEAMLARAGLDIELIPGSNTTLSKSGLEIISNANGLVVVEKTKKHIETANGFREFTKQVRVKVNEVLRVSGKDATSVLVNSAIEIEGNLLPGSMILSDSQVFVTDEVEPGATIDAGDDVVVQGGVTEAMVSCDGDAYISRSVSGSRITARGKVIIGGAVRHSTVAGESVAVESIHGSSIVARHDVTLQRIEADVGEAISSIYVGVYEFFMKRLKDNHEFLKGANASLEKIRMVLGSDIVEQITPSNTRLMLMKFLSRQQGVAKRTSQAQFESYRDIMDAILPTKMMISEKERECDEIADMLASNGNHDESRIIIHEPVAPHTFVEINGKRTELPAAKGCTELLVVNGRVHTSEP